MIISSPNAGVYIVVETHIGGGRLVVDISTSRRLGVLENLANKKRESTRIRVFHRSHGNVPCKKLEPGKVFLELGESCQSVRNATHVHLWVQHLVDLPVFDTINTAGSRFDHSILPKH